MATIKTVNGYDIIIDNDDWEEVSEHKWTLFYSDKSRSDRTYVRTADNKHLYLHRLLLDLKRKPGQLLVFDNGNRLDYRKENITITTEWEVKKQNKLLQEKPWWWNRRDKIWKVKENNCVIKKTKERMEDLLCSICSIHYYSERYTYCLDIAARFNWPGWRNVEGKWCDDLQVAIDKARKLERTKASYVVQA